MGGDARKRFWLTLFVTGLTNVAVIATSTHWGMKVADSRFSPGHSCFGVGRGFAPYTKRESLPIGMIRGRAVGHGAIQFGGTRVSLSDDK